MTLSPVLSQIAAGVLMAQQVTQFYGGYTPVAIPDTQPMYVWGWGWKYGERLDFELKVRASSQAIAVSSVVVSGNVVTVTTQTDHNLSSNDYIYLAGPDDIALAGVSRITVTSATTFTFARTADNQTATGTIKYAPVEYCTTIAQLNSAIAAATAGSVIIIADGTYTTGWGINVSCAGALHDEVLIGAETEFGVVFGDGTPSADGNRLNMANASDTIVWGLHYDGTYYSSSESEILRQTTCTRTRITNIKLTDCGRTGQVFDRLHNMRWGGTDNSIDHIYLDAPTCHSLVVYDFDIKRIFAISRSGTTVTVTCPGHGFSTGNVVHIFDIIQSEFNGNQTITVLNAGTFTYQTTSTNSPTFDETYNFPGAVLAGREIPQNPHIEYITLVNGPATGSEAGHLLQIGQGGQRHTQTANAYVCGLEGINIQKGINGKSWGTQYYQSAGVGLEIRYDRGVIVDQWFGNPGHIYGDGHFIGNFAFEGDGENWLISKWGTYYIAPGQTSGSRFTGDMVIGGFSAFENTDNTSLLEIGRDWGTTDGPKATGAPQNIDIFNGFFRSGTGTEQLLENRENVSYFDTNGWRIDYNVFDAYGSATDGLTNTTGESFIDGSPSRWGFVLQDDDTVAYAAGIDLSGVHEIFTHDIWGYPRPATPSCGAFERRHALVWLMNDGFSDGAGVAVDGKSPDTTGSNTYSADAGVTIETGGVQLASAETFGYRLGKKNQWIEYLYNDGNNTGNALDIWVRANAASSPTDGYKVEMRDGAAKIYRVVGGVEVELNDATDATERALPTNETYIVWVGVRDENLDDGRVVTSVYVIMNGKPWVCVTDIDWRERVQAGDYFMFEKGASANTNDRISMVRAY